MSTFVLVHGAYHGGWCWTRVSGRLRAEGHDVHTPTLTGLGERIHLKDFDVRLDTHIVDVANLIEWEDLRDIILVGHSYGGCVITGVAEQAAERIARLVYVDGIVPEDGQSVVDVRGGADKPVFDAAMARGPKKFGDAVPAADLFGVSDPTDIAWMHERLTAHPRQTLIDKIRLPRRRAAQLPRLYILCGKSSPISGRAQFDKLRNDPAWELKTIDARHDAMVTEPETLSAALLEIAEAHP